MIAGASRQSLLHAGLAAVSGLFAFRGLRDPDASVVSYQPANRYWPLQWYEMAVFIAAAVILFGACIWWVRRRLV